MAKRSLVLVCAAVLFGSSLTSALASVEVRARVAPPRVERTRTPATRAGPLQASLTGHRLFVPHEVLVRFRPTASRGEIDRATALVSGDMSLLPATPVTSVRLSRRSSVWKAVAQLRGDPSVAYAEPNFLRYTSAAAPNDPRFGEQWGLNNLGQEHPITDPPPASTTGKPDADADVVEAWNVTQGSADVVVAVIDTGIDLTHPDLVDSLWVNPDETANGLDDDGNGLVDDLNGYDFFDGDPTPTDLEGHGTHVAGIVAAGSDDGQGISGVCPGCRVMVLRAAAHENFATSAILSSIGYARAMGADIINMSFGTFVPGGWSKLERDAIKRAGSQGILTVAAAGNDARNNDALVWDDDDPFAPSFPASYDLDSIVSVAASNDFDRYGYSTGCYYDNGEDAEGCWFSNYGYVSVDLAAPGVDIVSTIPGDYDVYDGTSMASPFVAGVAGLVKSANPSYTAGQIRGALLNSVDTPGSLAGLFTATDGRVNARSALDAPIGLSTRPDDGTIRGAVSIRDQRTDSVSVANADVNDIFRMRLRKGTIYEALLEVPAGKDFDLYVWRPGTLDVWQLDGGCRISCALDTWSLRGKGKAEYVRFRAKDGGVYYFHVTAFRGGGRYTLTVGVP